MRGAARKEFDVLVIARLDRLTRNIRYLNAIISEICVRYGVELVSVEEGLDTSAAAGQLAINIIDIFTKWDSKRISDRTREIIARKRERGERVGHAPFGYTYQNKKLVEVPEEQHTMELIGRKRAEGMSYHKIARLLNEENIVSKRGGIWYAETVKTVYQSQQGRKKTAAS
jgi:DNA invertase Pin-like site-specific DNA recombinase